MKKSWIVSSKINGDISKIIEGEFNMDNKSVKNKETLISLKNSSSVNMFKIKTKLNIIKNTYKRDLI